ncbi:protein ALTERED PHOSPHATE STARVATION RESPONSE 1-like [Zingiber officinale]|uniref:protein ALTERED PHOSPHATE STARVATION RESPONSE 1-like n=1 Tax=Zingiber officinale TaxID=94328 RepID=UPI001C4B18A4|nr:protein ALTERED PHOSPHATE STARVATION RESPONSE 1-like [Zingiber officinale]
MGTSASKPSKNGVLLLCKDRIEHTKLAIDSRYALSAAHLSYIQSLRSVGAGLRKFAEADLLLESSLSTSEVEKSPSHSSYASPSPSGLVECVGSPLSASPLTPTAANMSYMRATGVSSVSVTLDHQSATHFSEEDSLTFPLPPPPPPPLDIYSSWDFFGPAGVTGKVSAPTAESHQSLEVNRMIGLRQIKEVEEVIPFKEEGLDIYKKKTMDKSYLEITNQEPQSTGLIEEKSHKDRGTRSASTAFSGSVDAIATIAGSDPRGSTVKNATLPKELCPEREDFSEFITHRAKDFVSSMRDIENRFLRAAEAGDEVSRMLETKKIRLGISTETIGRPHAYQVLVILNQVCCTGETSQKQGGSNQNAVKIITWNRSISSLSSSSKSPLAKATNDDAEDTGSDFVDEFSMISGSHSSTLERLYAWERKLYDEIKASERIRRVYDQKCNQLRHQIARDLSTKLIDKTRTVVKDLHSRSRVAIHSVDSISKRIEKMRDEELHPQLMELVQGLIRMWKAMLESHHTQFIKISLAYYAKTSAVATQSEVYKQALVHLERELEYFSSRFANWVDAHKSYVEALNGWLQKCILQPQERRKGRKKPLFPPRQAISPPIFVVLSDWLSGLNSIPTEELLDSIKGTVLVIHDALEHQVEDNKAGKVPDEPEKIGEPDSKGEVSCKRHLNLDGLQTSLTCVFDRLTKFSEAALKVYEDVKQSNEIACIAYSNAGMRYLL